MPDEQPVMRTAGRTMRAEPIRDSDAHLACRAMLARDLPGAGRGPRGGAPDPELLAPDDAIVRIEATGVCGSDLHIYHGRVTIEPGFTIGHEFVGTVVAAGDAVTRVRRGRPCAGLLPGRVRAPASSACRGLFHKCDESRVFGHGATLGDLQGTQAELALVPRAEPVPAPRARGHVRRRGAVRRRRDGHRLPRRRARGHAPGDRVAVLGLGPGGPVRGAGGAGGGRGCTCIAIDAVAERLAMAERFGAQPVHLTEQDVRAEVKARTEGRGVDVCRRRRRPSARRWTPRSG